MKKLNLSLIGFLQALGVLVYCGLISGLFWLLDSYFRSNPPQFAVMLFMLVILVFSAAVTGSLVFGYSVYLAMQKEIKQALKLLGFTLLYSLGFVLIIVILLFLV